MRKKRNLGADDAACGGDGRAADVSASSHSNLALVPAQSVLLAMPASAVLPVAIWEERDEQGRVVWRLTFSDNRSVVLTTSAIIKYKRVRKEVLRVLDLELPKETLDDWFRYVHRLLIRRDFEAGRQP